MLALVEGFRELRFPGMAARTTVVILSGESHDLFLYLMHQVGHRFRGEQLLLYDTQQALLDMCSLDDFAVGADRGATVCMERAPVKAGTLDEVKSQTVRRFMSTPSQGTASRAPDR